MFSFMNSGMKIFNVHIFLRLNDIVLQITILSLKIHY